MDRTRFLTQQYDRMIASGDYVVEQWRSSKDRFITDMWDRTPLWANQRRLEPIDPLLGFSPDNVEWHFRPVRKKSTKRPKPVVKAKSKPTYAERKANELASREAKRKALAEEFQRWEQMQSPAKAASK